VCRTLVSLAALVSLLLPGAVRAAESGDATAERSRSVAVSVNPLALGIARAGGNVEVAVGAHHSVVASGFYASRIVSLRGGDTAESRPSVGGELGVRTYFLPRAIDGAFIAASALVEHVIPERGIFGNVVYGGAVDVGGQIVTRSGFVLGAGIGMQYTTTTVRELEVSSYPALAPTGVYPRLLMNLGWSF
jgi:hypothetical protein